MRKTVLTIAGSDPSGDAGIQMDLRTFHLVGVNGATAITAVTAQNEKRFYSVNPVSVRLLREQIHAILEFRKIDAVKIGMLGTEDNVFAVYRFLEQVIGERSIGPVVLDPILKSSTGAILLEPKGVNILRQYLIPLVTMVTPNLAEAEILSRRRVRTVEEMKEAAHQLYSLHKGVKAILIKGGHLEGEDATDVLYDGEDWTLLTDKKIDTTKVPGEIHGTGCVLSAAIAGFLAKGCPISESVKKAKKVILTYIKESCPEIPS